jgi:hypothetical protein
MGMPTWMRRTTGKMLWRVPRWLYVPHADGARATVVAPHLGMWTPPPWGLVTSATAPTTTTVLEARPTQQWVQLGVCVVLMVTTFGQRITRRRVKTWGPAT